MILLADEINVKKVVVDANLNEEVKLDINLTEELIEEGKIRDAIRMIQDLRKDKGLKPSDKMNYEVPDDLKGVFGRNAGEIKKATNIEF